MHTHAQEGLFMWFYELMSFQNSRLLLCKDNCRMHIQQVKTCILIFGMGAATRIFVLFLRLENKELKLPFGVVALNRVRQISQL